MTGIGRELLYSYSSAKTDRVPKNIKQQIAGFVSNDEEKKPGADVSKIRRALRTGAKELASEAHVSVIDDMKLYSKALKKQRETAKDTALEKKKVRYSVTRISSKIIGSKTSTAAREAVSSAKREIQKLKAAKRSGKYDEEELEAALDHAKSMERIARKKVRHLEEEEMARRCSSDREEGGSVAADEIVDKEDTDDAVQKEIDDIRDDLGAIEKKADKDEYEETQLVTNEMISDLSRGMEEMLDAIEELNDLMNELVSAPTDMKSEDIDAMKIKHRNKEMKDITKADAEYLKAVFEHYDRAIDVAL